MRAMRCGAVVVVWTCAGEASAGSVVAEGNVEALTQFSEMGPLLGAGDFDDGPLQGAVPADAYAAEGLVLHQAPLTQVLPGVTTEGMALLPAYESDAIYFPQPVKNGGVQAGRYAAFGGVATFTVDVTQFGLTASRNGVQYLTVWDKSGTMLGQVRWTPEDDAAFVGVDTKGVPIGMLAYGNHDLWAGEAYDFSGLTPFSDTWVWAADGPPCDDDADCADGDLCNGEEVCVAGDCVLGPAPDCGDDNACTDDACDPVQGCVNPFNVAPCEDADACTLDTVCAGGVCGGGAALDCGDDDACTADMCDAVAGCSNAPIAGCCDGDDDCARDEVCDLESSTCVASGMTSGDGTSGDGTTGDGTTAGVGSTGGETTGDATTGGTGGDSGGAVTTGGVDPTTGGDATGATTGDTTGDTTGATDGATSGADGDDGGCGCRSGGDPRDAAGSLALLVLAALGRRRR